MNKIFNALSIAFGVAGGILTSVFGEWNTALWTLLVMIALDYITGIIKAAYTKNVSSEIGYKGILKKTIILVIVALANAIQEFTGGVAVREMVIMFYIANEGISIFENAAVVSPNMPEKLKDILLQIRGDNNDNRN